MPALQTSSWHRHWLALDNERVRQLDAWSSIHRFLERQPAWFDLSDEERAEAERISGLSELDARFRVIQRRLRRWLRFLATTPNQDLTGVIATLQIAERLLPPEENFIVHRLIARAVRDLDQIRDAR